VEVESALKRKKEKNNWQMRETKRSISYLIILRQEVITQPYIRKGEGRVLNRLKGGEERIDVQRRGENSITKRRGLLGRKQSALLKDTAIPR